ncbi:alpha/beta hydrolase [Robbsia sp. Bb-Pol-6]|uniref:Alpha/beta hydrolase n=1 Tax=Robbsia betulipollinis TaxID=2981849 RepID=A0ABT3ZHB3_9BURK|nr:alpha/beta hydrolase [Robbsia betulipollinis]MCY0385921.1 alpha/beta hydrolase [Robbsia betulipollinis]
MWKKILSGSAILLGTMHGAMAADAFLTKSNAQCENPAPAAMRDEEVASFYRLQVLGAASMDGVTRIYYGKGLDQYGDLRLPRGAGPFPLAIVVHGGAWLASVNADYTAPLAKRLADAGIATWNIEYSRIGSGGEWPGSFKSVAAAADFVRVLARQYPIDLQRVITVGHSSGGHYALWLAARHNLKADSPLYDADPLPLRGVVSLDGTPDLAAFAALPRGRRIIPTLLGADTDAQWQQRYAETSPVDLVPLGVPQYFLTENSDRLASILSYIHKSQAAGDAVTYDIACPPNHFTTVDVAQPTMANAIVAASRRLLNGGK